jgi:hypothetical protein
MDVPDDIIKRMTGIAKENRPRKGSGSASNRFKN